MPFVTEAIWEYLPVEDDAPALMVAAWPDAGDLSCWIDDEAEQAPACRAACHLGACDARRIWHKPASGACRDAALRGR